MHCVSLRRPSFAHLFDTAGGFDRNEALGVQREDALSPSADAGLEKCPASRFFAHATMALLSEHASSTPILEQHAPHDGLQD